MIVPIVLSVIIVSLISLVAIIPFLSKRQIPEDLLVFLMSLSVGTLLGSVFFHFLPEIIEEGYSTNTGISILSGFVLFFLLEKLIHWHHSKKCEHHDHGHSHAYQLAPINLIGDGVHNFLDGLVIAGSYFVSLPVGIAATIAVALHELPQELADFSVLIYSGMKKTRAVLFNLLSALMALVGAFIGIFLYNSEGLELFILPFAVGNFLYIAASNLVPELHRKCGIKDTVLHVVAIILGAGIMIVLGQSH